LGKYALFTPVNGAGQSWTLDTCLKRWAVSDLGYQLLDIINNIFIYVKEKEHQLMIDSVSSSSVSSPPSAIVSGNLQPQETPPQSSPKRGGGESWIPRLRGE
jgi:hypothetical protein